jgi:hypothetical protein
MLISTLKSAEYLPLIHIITQSFFYDLPKSSSALCNLTVFLTVHPSIELFHLPTLMHNSLFINNMYSYTTILDMF